MIRAGSPVLEKIFFLWPALDLRASRESGLGFSQKFKKKAQQPNKKPRRT